MLLFVLKVVVHFPRHITQVVVLLANFHKQFFNLYCSTDLYCGLFCSKVHRVRFYVNMFMIIIPICMCQYSEIQHVVRIDICNIVIMGTYNCLLFKLLECLLNMQIVVLAVGRILGRKQTFLDALGWKPKLKMFCNNFVRSFKCNSITWIVLIQKDKNTSQASVPLDVKTT